MKWHEILDRINTTCQKSDAYGLPAETRFPSFPMSRGGGRGLSLAKSHEMSGPAIRSSLRSFFRPRESGKRVERARIGGGQESSEGGEKKRRSFDVGGTGGERKGKRKKERRKRRTRN